MYRCLCISVCVSVCVSMFVCQCLCISLWSNVCVSVSVIKCQYVSIRMSMYAMKSKFSVHMPNRLESERRKTWFREIFPPPGELLEWSTTYISTLKILNLTHNSVSTLNLYTQRSWIWHLIDFLRPALQHHVPEFWHLTDFSTFMYYTTDPAITSNRLF